MKLRGVDADQLSQIRNRLTTVQSAATRLLGDAPNLTSTIEFTQLARELNSLATSWLTTWPGADELTKDRREAAQVYQEAYALLGPDVDGLLADASINPRELHTIVELTKRKDLLDRAPQWIWLLDDDSPTSDTTKPPNSLAHARALLRPEIRNRIQTLLHHLDELDEPTALQWLDGPPPGETVSDHIDHWYNQVRDFFRTAPVELVSVLKADRAPGASLHTLVQDVSRFPYLKESLQSSVADQILEHLRDVPGTQQRLVLAEFCDAVDHYRNKVGDPKNVSFDVLHTLVVLARANQVSATTTKDTSTHAKPDDEQILLSHNWMIDNTRTRATLVLGRPDRKMQYAVLTAPLVLETTRPRDLAVRIDWQYSDVGETGAWPKNWPRPEPDGAIRIHLYQWRRLQQRPSTHQYCFTGRFPIRMPRKQLRRFHLTATITDDQTKRELAKRKLEWESFLPAPQPLAVRWRDEASPEYVQDHPIGPQLRAKAILTRLQGGSSVAVTAPRRFGKSSLVAFLLRELQKQKILTPAPVQCTYYGSSAGFDHQRLWSDVSNNFQDLVGSTLGRVEAALPGPTGFDHIRRAAKTKGYSAVVLLFDEAQLFFPSTSGWEIGARLKTLLANHWSRTDDPNLPPVLFGLVGLPSLSRRAGAPAMGLLHPVEHDVMDESQLQPLITQLASGLQTSREARSRLAETAGNLLVLRAMLESLVRRLEQEERTWANFDDVVAVEEELKRHLQHGRQEHVASWIRDVLNGADRVDAWEPLACFPTAVGLALTRTPRRRFVEAISETTTKLNEWCRSFAPTSANIIPRYDERRVSGHLLQLKDRQIVGESEFLSGFLEAWLTGVGRRAAFDEAFQRALHHGAHRQIDVPKVATKVRTGGQATIWRDGDRAYRVRALSSDRERQFFLESTEMLQELREIIARREAGSDHVFEIAEMGLTRSGNDAVQVYRWVPGEDLAKSEGALG